MATEKQRRRRAKGKRHVYDLVEIDAEGNETVVSASEVRGGTDSKPKPKQTGQKRSRWAGARTPQPPSWNRVLKRTVWVVPAFFLLLLVLGGNQITIVGAAIQAIFLLLIFVPFSYFLDGFVWRQHVKRTTSTSKR
jgi:hypothetical protein